LSHLLYRWCLRALHGAREDAEKVHRPDLRPVRALPRHEAASAPSRSARSARAAEVFAKSASPVLGLCDELLNTSYLMNRNEGALLYHYAHHIFYELLSAIHIDKSNLRSFLCMPV